MSMIQTKKYMKSRNLLLAGITSLLVAACGSDDTVDEVIPPVVEVPVVEPPAPVNVINVGAGGPGLIGMR